MGAWLLTVCWCVTSQVSSAPGGADAQASLLHPAFAQRMSSAVREVWLPAQVGAAATTEGQADVPRLREELFRWLLSLVRPRWLAPDLAEGLRFVPYGERLEWLQRSSFHARYSIDGSQAQLKAYWDRIALLVRPPEPLSIPGLRMVPGSGGGPSWRPWSGAPPAARSALCRVWEEYLVVPPPQGAEGQLELYFGAPELSATVPDLARGWSGECLVWTDGHVVGVLLTKPEAMWRTALALRYHPRPTTPPVPPLNPEWVAYEDSRLYRDGDERWVSAPERAAHDVLRLIHLRAGLGHLAGAKSEYSVPVVDGTIPESTWRACEFDCLSRSTLTAAQGAAREANQVEPFLSRARRRASLEWMRSAKAHCERLRTDYRQLQAPRDAVREHSAIVADVDRAASLCGAVLSHWEEVLWTDPEGSADAYRMHYDGLLRTLGERALEPQGIFAHLPHPLIDYLNQQLQARAIARVAR